jgi:uncharacterized protein (DUF1697 family)
MKTYIVLLRGVTPTGRNRVPMDRLRAALDEAGLRDVRTYIQSGNVIARSDLDREGIQRLTHDTIAKKIGADIMVIARSPEQFRRVMARCPFPEKISSQLYFSLLASRPSAAAVRELRRIEFAPDEVQVIGDTIYTRYATRLSDSRFHNNFFERKLKVAATTRNFNTMTRLIALSA